MGKQQVEEMGKQGRKGEKWEGWQVRRCGRKEVIGVHGEKVMVDEEGNEEGVYCVLVVVMKTPKTERRSMKFCKKRRHTS